MKQRIPELNGVRAIAILLVVGSHYFNVIGFKGRELVQPILNLGYSGVDLFFVLSGFLLTRIALQEQQNSGFLAAFYRRRFFRIMPLYYVFLACAIVVTLALQFEQVPWGIFALQLQPIWLMTQAKAAHHYLAITWSLGFEEYFYLLLPLALRWMPKKAFVAAAILGLFLLPSARAIFHASGWTNASHLFRFDGILWGVLIAVALFHSRTRELLQQRRPWIITLWFVLLGGIAIMQAKDILFYLAHPYLSVVGVYSWMNAFYALSVLLVLLEQPMPAVRWTLKLTPLRFIGQVSYFIYLFHMLVYTVAHSLLPRVSFVSTVACALLTLALAWLSWNFFEAPLIAFGRSSRDSKPCKIQPVVESGQ